MVIKINMLLVLLLLIKSAVCQPVVASQESGEDNDADNHEFNAITKPNTRIVDLDNVDSRILEQLQSNNINLTALRVEQAILRSKKLQKDDFNPVPAPLTQAPADGSPDRSQ